MHEIETSYHALSSDGTQAAYIWATKGTVAIFLGIGRNETG
jgi:hypothetical protein